MDIVAVLVHGGGQGPWAWDRVHQRLKSSSRFSQIIIPPLPTTGSTTHTLTDDITTVASTVKDTSATRIILVGHSLGATVAAAALQNLNKDTLSKIRLVMVAGLVIPAGMSVADFGAPPPYMNVEEVCARPFDLS